MIPDPNQQDGFLLFAWLCLILLVLCVVASLCMILANP